MRTSGILMHITSLPSPGGIGDLGKAAYSFADFLHTAGCTIWQVLPVGPTGYGESPYQSPSAYAGNPMLISLESLREEGILSFEDREVPIPADPEKADFDAVRTWKARLLRQAFQQSGARLRQETDAFRRENAWVDDYALFASVKSHFGEQMWTKWPDRSIRNRRFWALWKYRRVLREEIEFHVFCQYLFMRQWFALKKYCNGLGIRLFGDMPIYVAEDSADTWTHPEVFQLDRNRIPVRVAGVPPDIFSADGQLWGNPLYRWDYLEKRNYFWWVDRMRAMSRMYDLVRIDHLIGFCHYYSIPYGAPNARNGEWIDGPGRSLFETLRAEIPDMHIIAEDLGAVNDDVRALMKWTGYPGMKVLSFAFDGDETNPHHPSNFSEHMVIYTGTHDNDTILSWAEKADSKALAAAKAALGFKKLKEAPEAFVRGALNSPCDTAVIPMQDLLELGGCARMNLPGSVGGNWLWRMKPGAASPALAARLRDWLREAGRLDSAGE